MYCSQCGTKMPADSKFCHNCGNKLDVHAAGRPLSPNDHAKILKQGKFRLKTSTFGFAEKGSLTLFDDRLEWKGQSEFTIEIRNIVNVAVRDLMGTGSLEISQQGSPTFKFFETNVTANVMAAAIDVGLAAMTGTMHQELESWRQIIEKFRGC